MRFVNHEPRDGQLAEQAEEVIRREPLGRDVHEAELAPARGAERFEARFGGEQRV